MLFVKAGDHLVNLGAVTRLEHTAADGNAIRIHFVGGSSLDLGDGPGLTFLGAMAELCHAADHDRDAGEGDGRRRQRACTDEG